MRSPRARFPAALTVGALLLLGCGADEEGADPQQAARRGKPVWDEVLSFGGSGAARKSYTLGRGVKNWRVSWRCRSGSLRLTLGSDELVDGRCPRQGSSQVMGKTVRRASVRATGRWRFAVEQRATPLYEPRLASMTAPRSRLLGQGDLYPVDETASGRVSLYRLASGRLAVRLERFKTLPLPQLFVWLVPGRERLSTRAIAKAPRVVLRELKSTRGNQNYLVPSGVTPAQARSVVIWCKPARFAFAAATLSG